MGKNHSVGTARQAPRSRQRSLSPSPVGPDPPNLRALAVAATVLTNPPDGMFRPVTMTRADWPWPPWTRPPYRERRRFNTGTGGTAVKPKDLCLSIT
jgi:hypothetical protein